MNAQTLAEQSLNWLWQTTWQTLLLAGAIAVITRIFRRRLSPGAVSLLWMLVFIRLVMPALPGSPVSIFALFESEAEPIPTAIVGWAPPTLPDSRWAMPTLRVVAEVPAADRSDLWMNALLATWLAGAGVVLGHAVISTIRFTRRLSRAARPAEGELLAVVQECASRRRMHPPRVLFTDLVSTPAVFGAMRPKLLLPPGTASQLTRNELRSVLFHELEHTRRRHLLTDWLFTLIKAFHWFDPAAWWAHRQIRAARELICDQAVLANLDEATSRQYGLTMLAMAGSLRPGPAGVPVAAFARDYQLLKQRIEAIAGKRRYLTGLGVLLAAGLGLAFLTKPAEAPAQDVPATRPATAPAVALNPSRQATTQEVVKALIERANQLVRESDYEQAVVVLKQVLEHDPKNEFARNALPLVEDRSLIEQQRRGRQQIGAVQRDRRVAQDRGQRAEDAAILAQLDRNLPEVRFDNIGLADVVDFLRDVSGANIFVNWMAIEDAGVPRDKPVTARLRDVKFSKALETILRDVGGEKVQLGYTVDEGVITISTADDLQARDATRGYDVTDLLLGTQRGAPPERKKELLDGLIRLITDTVARDSWQTNGGKVGVIREVEGQLIITQTPDNHREIARLLTQLRETRGVQIALSAKLIDMPKARAAALVVDPATGCLIVEDNAIDNFAGPDVQILAAPRITTLVGQNASIMTASNDLVLNIGAMATVSAEGKLVNMTLATAMNPGVPAPQLVYRQIVISVLDGSTALAKLGNGGPDREQWIAIKPTIVFQRERP